MVETIFLLLGSHTFRVVSTGTITIGVSAGVLGCFAYLQHQSLTGSVVAHSSLSGIALAFLASWALTGYGSTNIAVLLPGAAATGMASMFLARKIVELTPIRIDTAMAVSMSLFFGAGFFLLRIINVRALPGRAGLNEFLFGQAALITWADLRGIVSIATFALLTTVLFWKEFKIVVFDPSFTASLGFRTRFIEGTLLFATVLSIVLGLKSVGVVLMIALLVGPAAAARQWTKRLSTMTVLSALFGAVSGVGGAIASALYTGVPTGPVISIVAVSTAIVSVIISPKRGAIARLLRLRRNRQRFRSISKEGAR